MVDFDSSFDNFDGGDGESKPVTGVCHGEEDRKASDIKIFVSERDRVFSVKPNAGK